MIMKDLKETATKGGDMFIPRMTPYGLELFKLGSNNRVWVLDIERNIESINQVRTLDETVTQVKICGNVENESRSPVLAVLQGDIAKYGTLQKIIAKEKDDSLNNAKIKGKSLLCGVQETITVFGIDINTIRAGDRVQLNSMDLIATSIRHELGSPGHMTVVLGNSSYVRRKYYAGSI